MDKKKYEVNVQTTKVSPKVKKNIYKKYIIVGVSFVVILIVILLTINSIHNQKTSNFVPLKYKSISSTLTEFLPYQTTKSKEELKRAFDQELEYEGAKKISPLEMKLYNEIDKLCKNNLFLEREKTWTKNELDRINNRYGKLIDVVKELAPEDLAEEILVKGADYQGRLGKK